ncbi:MAG: MFS transporter [Bacilli bacterium]|jgi:PPP family 3-phenylpropionic acid transporter|nr:MFS transporter [Bacilli bacterium]
MILKSRLFYIFTDFFNSVLLVFLPLLLKTFFQLSDNTFGTVMLIAGFFAIAGIILSHFIVVKFKQEKYALILEFILMLIAVVAIFFNTNIVIITITTGLCYLNRMAMYTIGDNMMVEIANHNKLSFGKFRSFGSIGWGLSFLLNGYLVMNHPKLFLIVWFIFILLAIINLLFLPTLENRNKDETKVNYRLLLKYPNVLKYLIIAIIIYVLIYSVPPFINFRILELNGKVEIYSLVTAILVILEFVMIYFANEYRKRMVDKNYLITIGIFLSIKMLLISMTNIPLIIYLTALFDPIIFGLILSFNPTYIKQSCDVKLNGLVLNIFGVLSLFFIALCSKFSSSIMEYFSLKYLFIFYLILALLVIILSQLFKIKDYSQEEF